ncbi:MAG TPA: ABC transporter permease [bacterium]
MRTTNIKRLLVSLVLVWGVLSIIFLIVHLAPGDPASLYLRPEIEPQTVENIRRQMGLEQPLWQQYFSWMKEFCSGEFGVSFSENRPVRDILFEAIPNTLYLTVTAFVLQLVVGIFLGTITALKNGGPLEKAVSPALLFVYSMPNFWLAQVAILIFALKLGWLPSSQMYSLTTEPGFWSEFIDRVRHLILPATVLSAPFAAQTARFVRGALLEVLDQDYIRTAKAYGLPGYQIFFKYALRNALLPVLTLFGLYLPFLLGGSVVTEYIFAWPGLGRVTVTAIFTHDFPVILASCFIAAISVILGNYFSDLLCAFADPRIRIKSI